MLTPSPGMRVGSYASSFRSFSRCVAYYAAVATGGALLAVLAGCGGGTSTTAVSPYSIPYTASCAAAASNATGKWVTVVDNANTPPGVTDKNFFSFNQPSVNGNGLLVFRGRAKAPSSGSAEPLRGVWAVDLCGPLSLQTIVDTTMPVPEPNNQVDPVTGAPAPAVFNETPSIPRIDISSSLLATRGNSPPVWTYTDPATGLETKAGTTGIFFRNKGKTITGVDNLGHVPEFSRFQVPGAPAGTKFDVFPGSPSLADGKYIVFKGNYTLPAPTETDPAATVSKTGVYFRDISAPANPVMLIADSNTLIPGESVPFGSTAPPSAANGKMVFTGLDNEDAPTKGGIYLAPLTPVAASAVPALTTIVKIGDPVPDRTGAPLADGSTFSAFGEGLSYDGRYVAFWGAWGVEKRNITLTCPAEGNKARTAYCLQTYPPDGTTTMHVPVDQGIFIHDTASGKTLMVARSGAGQPYEDFLYWVYSGRPPGTGSNPDDSDGEPPRWRSSAFVAVDGARGVVFKASRTPVAGETVPSSGIYAAPYASGQFADPVPVAEVGDRIAKLDPRAPAGSTILSVGLEREAIRNGWLTFTMSSIDPAGEAWAGVYVTHVSTLDKLPQLN